MKAGSRVQLKDGGGMGTVLKKQGRRFRVQLDGQDRPVWKADDELSDQGQGQASSEELGTQEVKARKEQYRQRSPQSVRTSWAVRSASRSHPSSARASTSAAARRTAHPPPSCKSEIKRGIKHGPWFRSGEGHYGLIFFFPSYVWGPPCPPVGPYRRR